MHDLCRYFFDIESRKHMTRTDKKTEQENMSLEKDLGMYNVCFNKKNKEI